jgi:lipid-binding SYLF domain-containing protein
MTLYMRARAFLVVLLLALAFGNAQADNFTDTIKVFQNAGESGSFFGNSYGYAVFPTIGKGGIGIGGAYGKGRVYAGGGWKGDTSMTQLSVGFQFGGQAYSQIIFFEDQRAYDEFTSGNFEFSADASAVAITPVLLPRPARLAVAQVPVAVRAVRRPAAATTRAWLPLPSRRAA